MTWTKELADEVRESWRQRFDDADVKPRMDDLGDLIYDAYCAGYAAGKASREGDRS
jgi:hypothetical protein